MRITAPHPGDRADLAGVDLSDPAYFTSGDAHLAWQTMRAEHPVHWTERSSGPGFWSVTRRADVDRVLRDHECFTSERGTVLGLLGFDDPAGGKMLAVSDPPQHSRLREPLGKPLSAHAVPDYAAWIRDLVRESAARAGDGEVVDMAKAWCRLPVATMVRLMDLPAGDVDELVDYAYASVAPLDPHYARGSAEETTMRAHYGLVSYFDEAVERRRSNLSGDLLSHLLTIEVNGAPLADEDIILNCYSLLLGAAVTTSQAINATLLALVQQGNGEGRWPAGVPAATAVEEALRWSSPALHFLRYAQRDVVLHDTLIGKGDAVAAWIPSANRDEAAFDGPYRFDPTRTPNRHLAFGAGPHRCVGISLARLTLRIVFEEFFARISTFELAAEPVHLVSNAVAGVVSLPVRFGPRWGG